MSTPTAPTKIPYRFIPEGQGGTFSFDLQQNASTITHIGTSGLFTCVGLYLPLSASGEKCFLAHISTYSERPTSHERAGKNISRQVHEKLKTDAALNKWTPQDVVEAINSGGGSRRVVMMCPDFKDGYGKFVIQGIKDFIGEAGAEALFDDENVYCERLDWQGFVVEQRSGEVSLLKQQWTEEFRAQPVYGMEDEEFEAKMEEGGVMNWMFHGSED